MLIVGVACRRSAPVDAPTLRVTAAQPLPVELPRESLPPSYLAIVRADRELDLSFKVEGIIERIGPDPDQDWREGQDVQQGALLARLHQGDFTNAVNSARARAELNRSLVQRNRQLRAEGAIAQQDLEVLEADLRASEAALLQALQKLADAELRAPINGSILARSAKSGETVSAGRPVLRIGDLSSVSVELGVPDRSLDRFHVGSAVDVSISAWEGRRPFRGTVTEVGVAAREDARLFKVVIKVPNPDGRIRAGMTAQVPLSELPASLPGEVRVPLSALVGVPGDSRGVALGVFVLNSSNRVERRLVTTGDIVGSDIVVRTGLTTNDWVVNAGAGALQHGDWVAVHRDLHPHARNP
jgi:RND family efflux transporter MFP subunit